MPTLSETLQTTMRRVGIGSRTLSKLTGIPRTSIDNWWDGTTRCPKHWRPLLQIARVLTLSLAEADALLAAAGYPTIATLAGTLPASHPDQKELQPWLEARPSAPAPSLATLLHQLRAPVADFVGRDDEISTLLTTLRTAASDDAIAALSGVRGMGGIGKTELAYLVATRLVDVFPDAQIVVKLHGMSATPLNAAQVVQQVIHAFVPDEQLPDALEALQARYRSLLYGRRVLILADDAQDAAQVRPLLPPAGSALLVTSRQRFTLPGMVTIDLEPLDEADAVALLCGICERLGEADAQAIARACGYLPLALRVNGCILHNNSALSVADHLARLVDERQRLAQLRDPDDRQLDVESSLALSHALLDAEAQWVFQQLGVLVADFDLPLARAVVEAPADVEATLHLLLRRNLVMYDVQRGRWRLHNLVRDLALRYLEAAGQRAAASWRYAWAAPRAEDRG